MWLEIVLLVLVYAVNIRTSEPENCLASRDTAYRVLLCPRDKEEWEQRSNAKNCSSFPQNCTIPSKFVYHCVINSFVNKTLEVCAPAKQIIGHSCVEYNERGGLIQESHHEKCNDPSSPWQCPFSYLSTDVYQYQQCFKAIGSSESNPVHYSHAYITMDYNRSSGVWENCDNSRERDWQIVAVVMIVINVVLFGTTLWMMVSRRETTRANGKRHSPEKVPLMKKNEEMKEREPMSGNNKFYVAAMDIGLRYYNMALCCSESPEDVEPLGNSERICIHTTKNSITFGNEAIKNCNGRKKGNISILDSKSNQVGADFVRELLKRIWNELRSKLMEKLEGIDLHFVFIVPMHWSDDDLKKLRSDSSAKVKEILKVDDLWVIRREETISPFMHEVNARVLCLNFNVDNLVVPDRKDCVQYANLHISSSFFDLTFWCNGRKLSSKGEKTEREWIPPHEHMLLTIGRIYGISSLEKWKKTEDRDYMSYIFNFEKFENDMNVHTDENHTFDVSIPDSLYKIAINEGASPDSIKNHAEKVRGITIKDKGTFVVRRIFFENCFQEIKETVSQKIIDEEEALKTVKCVVMTGAYSQIEILRREAENIWFKGKQITVVIPQDTQVFAMGGAYHIFKEVRKQMNEPLSEDPHNDCAA